MGFGARECKILSVIGSQGLRISADVSLNEDMTATPIACAGKAEAMP